MIRMSTTTVLALASAAFAQYEITIDVENPVLMPGESTTVRMYAGFDSSRDYAVATVITDFVTSVGSEGFGDAVLIDPMGDPSLGTSPGTPSAGGYDGIIAGQLNFPGGIGIFADPTNPIAFWEVTYTAPVGPAAPFQIDLSTMTSRYLLYIDAARSTGESRLDELVEGAATIRVIPAPASAIVLVGGILAMRRRR